MVQSLQSDTTSRKKNLFVLPLHTPSKKFCMLFVFFPCSFLLFVVFLPGLKCCQTTRVLWKKKKKRKKDTFHMQLLLWHCSPDFPLSSVDPKVNYFFLINTDWKWSETNYWSSLCFFFFMWFFFFFKSPPRLKSQLWIIESVTQRWHAQFVGIG